MMEATKKKRNKFILEELYINTSTYIKKATDRNKSKNSISAFI